MSAQNAQAMIELFQQDASLVEAIRGATSRDAAISQTVSLGKQKSLDFSTEELTSELRTRGLDIAENGQIESLSDTLGEEGELSDEALEAVAGGYIGKTTCRGNW